jgi:hypothetical protein
MVRGPEPDRRPGVSLPPGVLDAAGDRERTLQALAEVREGLEGALRALDALALRCGGGRAH